MLIDGNNSFEENLTAVLDKMEENYCYPLYICFHKISLLGEFFVKKLIDYYNR